MSMDNAIDYPCEGKGWFSKLATGGLMLMGSIFILPAFIFLGYLLEIIRRSMAGDEDGLREWNELGRKLEEGFKLWLALVLYGIPMLLIFAGLALSIASAQGTLQIILAAALGLLAALYCFFVFLIIIPVMVIISWTGSLHEQGLWWQLPRLWKCVNALCH